MPRSGMAWPDVVRLGSARRGYAVMEKGLSVFLTESPLFGG